MRERFCDWSNSVPTGARAGSWKVAWIATSVLQGLIRRFRVRIAGRLDDAEAVKRAETLGRVSRYLVAVVMSLVAGVLVLSEVGISVAPILGAAGVASIRRPIVTNPALKRGDR